MNALSDLLGHVSPAMACTVVAVAVLAESVLLVGAFVPTLAVMLTAGALARTGHISLLRLVSVAVAAVVVGDFLAHRTGRLLGNQLRTGHVGRRIPDAAWRRAEKLMTRHGGRTVFLGRFLPVVRTLVPHFAGVTRLPYRRIAPYSVIAACLWAVAEAGAGYAAATSLQRILSLGGPLLALILLSAIGVTLLWRRFARPGPRAVSARQNTSDNGDRSWPTCVGMTPLGSGGMASRGGKSPLGIDARDGMSP
ncbi:DedA family protein [Streptomyces sp. NPDC050625]|uniref:DedA family protein n=1 Tax=Streptomyces sp. NPDC050625 TaxID=3154629 RepID=UPI0034162B67